jgi:hypothetical protein
MAEVLTKAEFAARMGVSRAAVSMWVKRQKLSGSAVTTGGRIVVAVALKQLGARRDPGLGRPSGGGAEAPALAAIRLAKERLILDRLRREAEKAATEWISAADAERAWNAELADLMAAIEAWLVDDLLPKLLALYPNAGLDPRAVADQARSEFRAFRQRWEDHRAQVDALEAGRRDH